MSVNEHCDVVVIGGGQAGLAAGRVLTKNGMSCTVLESHSRLGESWRSRWDSLRLFTPAKFNGLPDLPFPGEDFSFPTKEEVADYLETYARRFSLPVRLGTTVQHLERQGKDYLLQTSAGSFTATDVIVATGGYQRPFIPSFSPQLKSDIVQLHSSAYKHPGQLPEGAILVVGAGNSGAEISIELARSGRKVWISGRNVGRIPADRLGPLFGGWPYWFFISKILSIHTPVGLKVRRQALHQGTPLIRLKELDIESAGVKRCARVGGANDGLPLLEDGQTLNVKGIVWATGYRPDFSWINLSVFDAFGYPKHERGIVTEEPGLYFLGLHFQTSLSSGLLGGVGADARTLAQVIRRRR